MLVVVMILFMASSCGSDSDNNGEESHTDLSEIYRKNLHSSWLLINQIENGESTISEKLLTGEDTTVITFYDNNKFQIDHSYIEDYSNLGYEVKRKRRINRKGSYLFYNRGLFSDEDEYVLEETYDYYLFGSTHTGTSEYRVSFEKNYTRLILDEVLYNKQTRKLIYDKIDWIPVTP